MNITHTIAGRPALRYLPHHHRGPVLNRTHAVSTPTQAIYTGAIARTICGAAIGVEELPERLAAANGGPLYNCLPASAGARVTCRDCFKKLRG